MNGLTVQWDRQQRLLVSFYAAVCAAAVEDLPDPVPAAHRC